MTQPVLTAAGRREGAALLGALFTAAGSFLSRAELARAANLSGAALELELRAFAEAGYPIEYHPQGGIGLGEPPDIWCVEEILGRCRAGEGGPGWDPVLLTKTGSTNDVVREQARKGARAGFLVAATRQTKGRGRLGRAWESPASGGLYVSILLRPRLAATAAGQLTVLSSVAARDAVEAVSGLRPQIKWPNDLQWEGRKLAGLLIETQPEGKGLAYAVVGIGINVRQQAEDFSGSIRELATSLRLATGRDYRRADVLVALLAAFERRLRAPFAEVRREWEESCLTLGQRVTLQTAQGRKVGEAFGLDEMGALLLRNDAGVVEAITAGDMAAI